jgi:cytochrome b6-f complex iron-sulfur subunit
MDRKDFIRTCGMACIGAAVLPVFLASCGSSVYYAKSSVAQNRLVINKSEFIVEEKNKFRKYVLVKSEKYNFPIYVFRFDENTYSALLMECTHKSCELEPHGEYIACPCHGSEFTNRGVVQNPPADKNLVSFKTEIDNENIYIQL